MSINITKIICSKIYRTILSENKEQINEKDTESMDNSEILDDEPK